MEESVKHQNITVECLWKSHLATENSAAVTPQRVVDLQKNQIAIKIQLDDISNDFYNLNFNPGTMSSSRLPAKSSVPPPAFHGKDTANKSIDLSLNDVGIELKSRGSSRGL